MWNQVTAMARAKAPNKVAVGALKTLCAAFTLFGDFTVDNVLANIAWTSMERDLDVVELWSGVQSIVNAAIAKGHTAKPYDKERVPGETDSKEDITSSRLRLHQRNVKPETMFESKSVSYVVRRGCNLRFVRFPLCSRARHEAASRWASMDGSCVFLFCVR